MVLKRDTGSLPILVFDVNETLLDVNALRPRFERIFNDAGVLRQWFAQVLLYSQTITQIGGYTDFGEVGRAALEMIATIKGIDLRRSDIGDIVGAMRSLPAHPEVSEQLERLREHGFRTAALTNSSEDAAKAQIENAGLSSMFERLFSVDAVRKYKPARDAYLHVANELAINTSQITMIASHPWDLMGAKAAGCDIAFIERKGSAWFPLVPPPKIHGTDLRQIANQFVGSTTDV